MCCPLLAFRSPLRPAVAAAASILLACAAGPVAAHTGAAAAGGFAAGFAHPLHGWDHLLAMIAVGLWAVLLGGRAVARLVKLFPLAMGGGAAFALAGIALPAVETGIAVSAIVLGLSIAAALRPPPWVAAALVALFAVCHGHAHGTELPAAVNAYAYTAGFLLATVLLHLAGAAVGSVARQGGAEILARLAGAGIAASAMAFLPGL
jgi:urease accessory protein